MNTLISTLEETFRAIPLSALELWGRSAYLVGIVLAVAAFGGFTFRPGGRWGLGRERQSWDDKAFLSIPLTFVLVFVAGFIGSGIVLVPGAQTFESLKDLAVFLCLIVFGYPALVAVPPAYMLSDLIEGVPPAFLQDWMLGYFINPACFWVAYQLIGKDPDFRKARTWGLYLVFVFFFMSIEPQLWGHICAGKFTPEIAYHNITPALFFTTSVTWVLAPFAMFVVLPLAKRYGLFWADIPGRVKERILGRKTWVWESGGVDASQDAVLTPSLPIRIFLAVPFIGLVLLMAGAAATVSLHRGQDAADALAGRFQRQVSETICLRLDDLARIFHQFPTADSKNPTLSASEADHDFDNLQVACTRESVSYPRNHPAFQALATKTGEISGLASHEPSLTGSISRLLDDGRIGEHGRVFLIDRKGGLVASSMGADVSASADLVVSRAVRALDGTSGGLPALKEARSFRFDIIAAKPLSRETWLARATPYAGSLGGGDWILVITMPEADYLSEVRAGQSQSGAVLSVGLVLSLLVVPLLAGAVAAPLLRVARSAQAIARGELSQRVEVGRLEELEVFAESFNHMASQLQQSRQALDADIERRIQVEQELRKSEEGLEELVAKRTDALTAANKELEAFSYSVSHDLRAPLRGMDGFAKILLEDFGERLDDTGRSHLERIRHAAGKMSNLIDGLLDLSRLNRRELETRVVDLSSLAEDVLQDLQAGDPGRTVDVRIAPGLSARADPHMIRQVLQNLLANAWKFTAKTAQARIDFEWLPVDGGHAFSIADNGAGFNMANTKKLFGPFQRLHSTQEFEGTGVGLAIVERVITRHGGRVWAKGGVNQGATFYFTLPPVDGGHSPSI